MTLYFFDPAGCRADRPYVRTGQDGALAPGADLGFTRPRIRGCSPPRTCWEPLYTNMLDWIGLCRHYIAADAKIHERSFETSELQPYDRKFPDVFASFPHD